MAGLMKIKIFWDVTPHWLVVSDMVEVHAAAIFIVKWSPDSSYSSWHSITSQKTFIFVFRLARGFERFILFQCFWLYNFSFQSSILSCTDVLQFFGICWSCPFFKGVSEVECSISCISDIIVRVEVCSMVLPNGKRFCGAEETGEKEMTSDYSVCVCSHHWCRGCVLLFLWLSWLCTNGKYGSLLGLLFYEIYCHIWSQ